MGPTNGSFVHRRSIVGGSFVDIENLKHDGLEDLIYGPSRRFVCRIIIRCLVLLVNTARDVLGPSVRPFSRKPWVLDWVGPKC